MDGETLESVLERLLRAHTPLLGAGEWSCTCNGWRNQSRDHHPAHVAAVAAVVAGAARAEGCPR